MVLCVKRLPFPELELKLVVPVAKTSYPTLPRVPDPIKLERAAPVKVMTPGSEAETVPKLKPDVPPKSIVPSKAEAANDWLGDVILVVKRVDPDLRNSNVPPTEAEIVEPLAPVFSAFIDPKTSSVKVNVALFKVPKVLLNIPVPKA